MPCTSKIELKRSSSSISIDWQKKGKKGKTVKGKKGKREKGKNEKWQTERLKINNRKKMQLRKSSDGLEGQKQTGK